MDHRKFAHINRVEVLNIKPHNWSKLSDVLTDRTQWKDEHNWFKWPHKQGKVIMDYTGRDFRMWPLSVLMGGHIIYKLADN